MAAEESLKLRQNEREKLEVELLDRKIKESTPSRGSQIDGISSFDAFTLSEATKRGRKQCFKICRKVWSNDMVKLRTTKVQALKTN